jgi:hypothetical protein
VLNGAQKILTIKRYQYKTLLKETGSFTKEEKENAMYILNLIAPELLLVVLVGLGTVSWIFGRNYGRKDATRTIATQIWNPDLYGSLQLLLNNGGEISPKGDGDIYSFRYPRRLIPGGLRFRGHIVGFWPHATVEVDGELITTEWKAGSDGKVRFRDLIFGINQGGVRIDVTFKCYGISHIFPYLRSRSLVTVITPEDDGTVDVREEAIVDLRAGSGQKFGVVDFEPALSPS